MHAFGHARSFCTRDPRDHLGGGAVGQHQRRGDGRKRSSRSGATVAATNAAIALTRSVTTNGEGAYTFANLPVGAMN